MKKTISSLILISFNTVLIASEEELLKRIENLEKIIADLTKKTENIKESQKEIAKITDDIETKALRDKLNITPELRLRADSFKYSLGKIDGVNWSNKENQELQENYNKDFNPALSVRLRLNMDYEAGDNTKFVGRLSINKNSQTGERICILHKPINTATAATTAFEIDKAYTDSSFAKNSNIPMIFTAGILPTSGGSSSNLSENKPRQSMFPSLIFDMNTYGVIGTIDLSKTVTDDTFLRAVIAKAYTKDKYNFYYQCNREVVKNADIYGLFLDSKLPIESDNSIYVGINKISNLKATPFVGSTSNVDADAPENLGSVINIGAGIEISKIADSRFTGFLNYGYSKFDANGNSVNYSTGNPMYGSKGLDYAIGVMPDKSGWALHGGFLYELGNKKSKIGIEYNQGSKYWWSATQGAEDVFNKLAIRGYATEAYIIQPLSSQMFLKAGYLYMKEKYTGSGWHFGNSYEKDGKQTNGYLLVNMMF